MRTREVAEVGSSGRGRLDLGGGADQAGQLVDGTDTVGQRRRKLATERRIIAGMIEAVAAVGYAEASVTEVLQAAGASRTAFYARWNDKHACFMAALAAVGGRVEQAVEEAVAGVAEPCGTAVGALVAFASEEPNAAKLLFSESLAAGVEARNARQALIERLAAAIEAEWGRLGEGAPGLDVPARALVGGVFRLLALRLRVGVGGVHELLGDLGAWVDSYAVEGGPFAWRSASGVARVELLDAVGPSRAAMPGMLPRGRHRLGASEVAANQRERLHFGLALAAFAKGYSATSVADVVARARLSREIFYAHFRDKTQAALETLEFSFELAMATTARAFFMVGPWPDRVWAAARAFDMHFRSRPEFANLVFVQAHEIGSAALPFLHQRLMAFTLLLEEGYREPRAAELPRTCSEAVAATAFELASLQAPRAEGERTPDMLPHSVYMALAPFVGPAAATALIGRQLDGRA